MNAPANPGGRFHEVVVPVRHCPVPVKVTPVTVLAIFSAIG